MSVSQHKTQPAIPAFDPLKTTDRVPAVRADMTTCLLQSEIRDWEQTGRILKEDPERGFHLQICGVCREIVQCLDEGAPPEMVADEYCREKTRQIPRLLCPPEVSELPRPAATVVQKPAKPGFWKSATRFFWRS